MQQHIERHGWSRIHDAFTHTREVLWPNRTGGRVKSLVLAAGAIVGMAVLAEFWMYEQQMQAEARQHEATGLTFISSVLSANCFVAPNGSYEAQIIAQTSKNIIGRDGVTVIGFDPARSLPNQPRHVVFSQEVKPTPHGIPVEVANVTQKSVGSMLDVNLYLGSISPDMAAVEIGSAHSFVINFHKVDAAGNCHLESRD